MDGMSCCKYLRVKVEIDVNVSKTVYEDGEKGDYRCF